MGQNGACALTYTLTPEAFLIEGAVQAEGAILALPVIARAVRAELLRGVLQTPPEPGFCLTPGFRFREYRIRPDAAGRFAVRLSP